MLKNNQKQVFLTPFIKKNQSQFNIFIARFVFGAPKLTKNTYAFKNNMKTIKFCFSVL